MSGVELASLEYEAPLEMALELEAHLEMADTPLDLTEERPLR